MYFPVLPEGLLVAAGFCFPGVLGWMVPCYHLIERIENVSALTQLVLSSVKFYTWRGKVKLESLK